MERIAYLGPEGSFAHQALGLVRAEGSYVGQPRSTVVAVLEAVEDGEADLGVVPFESSVEGQVNLTVDVLVHDAERLQVCGEVVLDVTFGAYRRPGSSPAAASAVASHPVALAQCRRWVHDSGLTARETSSTSEACRMVAAGEHDGLVAVASPVAAERWGLTAIDERIEDFPGAQTRFLVTGAEAAPATGRDRTMFVLVPPDDRAGVLLAALQELADRSLNLSVIASRPLRVRLGEYCFVLVVDAHASDAGVLDAFVALRAGGYSIKVLGAYPQWPS